MCVCVCVKRTKHKEMMTMTDNNDDDDCCIEYDFRTSLNSLLYILCKPFYE